MEVDLRCKSIVKVDIDTEESFRLLVRTLHMDFVIDEEYEDKFYTRKNNDGDICVYEKVNGHDELFDDRGELYEALISTAKCIFPNI